MILPVGFSLLLRRWLATLLFGVLALCGGLLMSGASAEAEPTSSIQRVASYDRGSTTTPTGNTRIVAVGADRELTEAPRPYASRIALGRATKAGRGGAGPVRLGQAGEDAVRGAYNIGDKVPIRVAGRGRIPDGLTPTTLSEVKNVGSLSYTRQVRDFEQYAQQTGRTFDLYVRPGARLSGPLRNADAAGRINIREIPR